MKTIICLLLIGLMISACGISPKAMQSAIEGTVAAFTEYPTYTEVPPFSTYTPYPTYTSVPSLTAVIIVITATNPPFTATITLTPTITPTPSTTPTATQTPNITQTEEARLVATQISTHGPGFYLVGVDIAPGVWRSSSSLDSCYWGRYDRTGEIIDNYFGYGGVTIYIAATDFSVELGEDCGDWTYLSQP